jgi:proteic killer suppression protein
MEVQFSNKKLKRTIEDNKECAIRFGAKMARKILLRMQALVAAESLATFWPPYSGPERCHELKGNLEGIFSMDVKQPYRLLFRPVDVPGDLEAVDEKQRWQAVKAVEITGVEDTHG